MNVRLPVSEDYAVLLLMSVCIGTRLFRPMAFVMPDSLDPVTRSDYPATMDSSP